MSAGGPRVAVTGASGLVGRAVATELERLGAEVVRIGHRAGARNDHEVDLGSAPATPVLVRAFEGCATVIHAAAHVHRVEGSARDRELFHAINVDGTSRVVEAAERAAVRRLVFVSTIGVHGFVPGRAADEDDAPAPESAYGATKWLAEQRVNAAPFDTRIARLATVVGAGDHANYARLARAIAGRRFVVPGDGAARKSLLAIDDAAALLARTALEERLPHRLFHLAHPTPMSVRAICDALADALGAPRPPSVPLGAIRGVAFTVDRLTRAVLGRGSFEDSVRKLARDAVVSTERERANFPGHRYRSLGEVASAYRTNVVEAGPRIRA